MSGCWETDRQAIWDCISPCVYLMMSRSGSIADWGFRPCTTGYISPFALAERLRSEESGDNKRHIRHVCLVSFHRAMRANK